MFDVFADAVGEALVYLFGRLLGRAFNIDGRRAQQLGEWILITVLVVTLVVVTLRYS